MDGQTAQDEVFEPRRPSRWRRKRVLAPLVLLALLLAAIAAAWFSRERIAGNLIEQQLRQYDIPATYKIERIGGRTQIIRDLVVGDPKAPDFTADRVIVRLAYRFGTPGIGQVKLVNPRIWGRYRNGQLSFGSLDKLLFRDTGEPPGLPELDLAVLDGRGLIETDFGPVGLKFEGAGKLSNGFSGIVAANAPALAWKDCRASRATAYGKFTSSAGEPRFEGPLRLARLGCPDSALALQDIAVALDAKMDKSLANPSLEARIDGGPLRFGDQAAQSLTGTVRAKLRDDRLTSSYTLAARGLETPQALAAVLTAEGVLRAGTSFDRVEVEADLEGNGIRPGRQTVAALASLSRSGEGTLLAPIARQIASALTAQARGSALEAELRLRKTGAALTVFLPAAELQGGGGERLVSVSRLEYSSDGKGAPRVAGNFATGGPGLPRMSGRMERGTGGDAVLRLAMAPYSAGGSSLAIPRMTIAQGASGRFGFSGLVEASGPLPGGSARNLRLPISGNWEPGGSFALWNSCTEVSFDQLALANLSFDRHRVTLCPPRGKAILRSTASGFALAAGAPSLSLSGRLGNTPIRLASGPVGFAWPGLMKARAVDVTLGPAATASRFRISDLEATLGKDINGRFADAEVMLAAVPLDLRNAGGTWRYAGGRLAIADAGFTLADRLDPDRFEPLAARGSSLSLENNLIVAHADLRHPASDRLVTSADIRHNLATGAGHADLDVPGLVFDDKLQPEDLTPKALGVIANAKGTVTGTGRINWTADGTVTSTGQFSSDSFDFAAAFGPVKGASGTIVFSDLLGLTTAPGQKIRIASVNPGIEVLEGEIEFSLDKGQFLSVGGASWPFMGGRLILKRVDLNLGISEERHYIFEIVGLQADKFIAQMELENISATGTFDGTIPIVFDQNGNGRIDEGKLDSRPPGGNISYVGALTYKDLTPIANFAFDALKSLDYREMHVAMEGPLTGEIVTRVRFDGVKQGAGAKQNFITRRLANLPLQFRINIKAQFYQLLSSLKALYDPAAVRDPRELGLVSDDGKRLLKREVTGEEAEPDIKPGDLIPDEPPIQQ